MRLVRNNQVDAPLLQGAPRAGDDGACVRGIGKAIHDRAQAIGSALTQATADDVVLVAGKGHEDYQVIGNERRPFSDAAVVLQLLAGRAGR